MRQTYVEPRNSTSGLVGAMWNGAMNKKFESEIPEVAKENEDPPSTDFLKLSPVVSAKSVFVLVGSTATYPPSPP